MRDVDIVEELERLKKKIQSTSREKANLEGKLESAYERLRTEFGLADEEEASTELLRLSKEEERLLEELDSGYSKLVEEYNL